jgi:hypothetical protein
VPDKPWKKRERNGAAVFGARRTIGSGSLGRDDRTRSDSTHERIFLEIKSRKSHSVITLWDQVKKMAKKESKIPVIGLAQKHRPGIWFLVHQDDFMQVAAEMAAARLNEIKQENGEE